MCTKVISRLLTVIILLLTIFYGHAEIDCGICSDPTNSTDLSFHCTGRNCDTFQFAHFQDNKTLTFTYLDCKQPHIFPLSDPCYFRQSVDSPYDTYRACNNTMTGCGFCYTNDTCQHCYMGYYQYTSYDIDQPWLKVTCQKCTDSILGCVICNSQYNCTQCQIPYLLINGICYERDGKTLPGGKIIQTPDVQLDTITIILIISVVLNAIGFLALIILTACKSRASSAKYDSLIQSQN